MKFIKSFQIALIAAAFSLAGSLTIYSQCGENKADLQLAHIEGSDIEGPNVERILRNVALKCNVRIAFISGKEILEKLPATSGRGLTYFPSEPDITPDSGTLASILDKLLRPRYSWTLVDDLLTITPRDGIDPLVQRFLWAKVYGPKINFNSGEYGSSAGVFDFVPSQKTIISTKMFSPFDGTGTSIHQNRKMLKGEITTLQLLNLATGSGAFKYWKVAFISERTGKKILFEII